MIFTFFLIRLTGFELSLKPDLTGSVKDIIKF